MAAGAAESVSVVSAADGLARLAGLHTSEQPPLLFAPGALFPPDATGTPDSSTRGSTTLAPVLLAGLAAAEQDLVRSRPVPVALADTDGDCSFSNASERLLVEFNTVLELLDLEPAARDAHPVAAAAGRPFYLTQCALMGEDALLPELLPTLQQHSAALFADGSPAAAAAAAAAAAHPRPPPAPLPPLVSATLWANPWPSQSQTHYDANPNLLLLLAGRKEVQLWEPAMAGELQAQPVHAACANHARPSNQQGCPPPTCIAALVPGAVLFIPEGWYHAVATPVPSVAVNFWFQGRQTQLQLGTTPSTRLYHLRHLLRSVLEDRLAAFRADMLERKQHWQQHGGGAGAEAGEDCDLVRELGSRLLAGDYALLDSLPMDQQLLVLPRLAAEQPALWRRALVRMPPASAETLLSTWEHGFAVSTAGDRDAALFYASVFPDPDPCQHPEAAGDSQQSQAESPTASLPHVVAQKREEFAREVASSLLDSFVT